MLNSGLLELRLTGSYWCCALDFTALVALKIGAYNGSSILEPAYDMNFWLPDYIIIVKGDRVLHTCFSTVYDKHLQQTELYSHWFILYSVSLPTLSA